MNHPLVYTERYRGVPARDAEEVKDWVKKERRGEMQGTDLLTDQFCTRGWEAGAILVVECGYGGKENMLMRGMSHVILVKAQ